MKKTLIIILFLLYSSIVRADTIILHNKKVFEGNVLNIDEETKSLVFDIVQDDKLIGAKMTFYDYEIKTIIVEDRYRNLNRGEVTEEEKKKSLRAYQQRTKLSDVDDIIRSRVNKRMNRKIKVQEANNKREHEKQIIKQQHRNRKDLITHSKNEMVTPVVKIEDSNKKSDTTITTENYY